MDNRNAAFVERLTNICRKIHKQNLALITRCAAADFNPVIELDSTLNNAIYTLKDFFDILKRFEYGHVPTEPTDAMLKSTDDLITAIRYRYRDHSDICRDAFLVGKAFRHSKLLWRIKNPNSDTDRAAWCDGLDNEFKKILAALDTLNATFACLPSSLPTSPVTPEPRVAETPPPPLNLPTTLPLHRRPLTKDWSQAKAAALLGISTRQIRKYKTKPPDAHWPGWEDPVLLKQWMNQREDRDLMAQAMSRHLPYRETATEKARKRN